MATEEMTSQVGDGFQDNGHVRHPYRDYVEGKTPINQVVRLPGSGQWIKVQPGKAVVSLGQDNFSLGKIK